MDQHELDRIKGQAYASFMFQTGLGDSPDLRKAFDNVWFLAFSWGEIFEQQKRRGVQIGNGNVQINTF